MHNFGGGRSDLFNSGGRWSKKGGGGDIFKIQGELAKRGVKKFRGFGPWVKLWIPPILVVNFINLITIYF